MVYVEKKKTVFQLSAHFLAIYVTVLYSYKNTLLLYHLHLNKMTNQVHAK